MDCPRRKVRAMRSPRKKKAKQPEKSKAKQNEKPEKGATEKIQTVENMVSPTYSQTCDKTDDLNSEKIIDLSDTGMKCDSPKGLERTITEETKVELCVDGQQNLESQTDDPAEWDCNTSIESIELRLSPEHSAAESESGGY